jgi:hypothetical protein
MVCWRQRRPPRRQGANSPADGVVLDAAQGLSTVHGLQTDPIGEGNLLPLPDLSPHVAEDGGEALVGLHLVLDCFEPFDRALLIEAKHQGVTE